MPGVHLTDRELEIVRLIWLDRSNQQIADDLVIAESTVKMHVRMALGKLGFHHRGQLAVWYERNHGHGEADTQK